ncbi:adenomatous polyposis coli protein-like isoform X1 [Vespula pensylvanica]|uniref:adenomatous polyposis coli protein-like isoform X1 n=1 Tax=Vespula pensylvanica TaxID=30213 RepID=UPI001CB9F380|nr:adenomatous polyposis coli protein-like isoform X1 [Vespula pensylvanica]
MDENTTETYDDDIRDQPVDYSKKYVERNRLKQNHLLNDVQKNQSANEDIKECESETVLFGDYAETDLDQPTDYSLRYAENDTDEDEKPTTEYFSGSVQEDTIKTYCTEGTPYETPFNFSTATSMSDLRVEDTKDNDHSKKIQKKGLDVRHKKSISFEDRRSEECHEQQHLITENTERQKHIINISSNHMIPEKPISYYKEEESSSSSCVNSLSSFNSEIAQRNNVSEIISKVSLEDSISKSETETSNSNVTELNSNELISASISNSPVEIKNSSRIVDKEGTFFKGKMVTFSGQDFYAEQTPLMFSRCSSLGSLSGFEQHSIHDDRSSVVSDFSRRTSGVVSPSELPDSPTQTVPPSPRIQKIKSTHFMNKMQEEEVKPSHSHLLCSKYGVKRTSVFEDDIATFKEESTPIEFSTATSLSSLTIDDEVKSSDYTKSGDKLEEISEPAHQNIEKGTSFVKVNVLEVEKQPEQISDGDEDDEDMLAACISMGMQNNRYRQSLKTESISKATHSKSSSVLMSCDKKSPLNRSQACVSVSPGESSAVPKICKPPMEIVVVPDTVHVYCTEDTPAGISPVGSQSNLSVLSMPSVPEDIEKIEPIKSSELECHRNDLSDESYNLSDEDEKILDECIQSGIPKVRQITPPPTKSIPCVKKPETMPPKFNICGTPSSSPVESTSNNKNPVIIKPLCHMPMENEKEFSDDSPNHSDDEAILIECIQSAKARLRCSPSPLLKGTKISKPRTQCPTSLFSRLRPEKVAQEHNTTSYSSTSVFYPTEDSYSPSEEEEDIILAQCIQSGMPKVLNVPTTTIQRQVATKKREEYLRSMGSSSSSTAYLLNNAYPINALYAQLPYKSVENSVSHYIVGSSSCSYNNFPTKASSSS